MRHPDTLTDRQRDQLNRILEACPDLATACDLAHEFSTIAREPRDQDLTHWITRALGQGPPPVQGFAAFLQNDWDAVVNGLTLPWSSGAVEGQLTRIELIKRGPHLLACGRWSSLSRRQRQNGRTHSRSSTALVTAGTAGDQAPGMASTARWTSAVVLPVTTRSIPSKPGSKQSSRPEAENQRTSCPIGSNHAGYSGIATGANFSSRQATASGVA